MILQFWKLAAFCVAFLATGCANWDEARTVAALSIASQAVTAVFIIEDKEKCLQYTVASGTILDQIAMGATN